MDDEHENISKEDFRLQAISTVAKDFSTPGGPLHKAGAAVMLVANTRFNNENLSFGLPNTSALLLNFSHRLWEESQSYLKEESNFSAPISKFMGMVSLHATKKELLFDAIEKRMGAIVFAYTALESFANQSIPADYIYRQMRNDKKFIEEYNREQIERHVSLDAKLSEVLPEVFGIKSPKSKKIWTEYLELKKVRDRIIHLKSDDAKSTEPQVKTIWTTLLNHKSGNCAVEAKNMISYFYSMDSSKTPRWLKKCPF